MVLPKKEKEKGIRQSKRKVSIHYFSQTAARYKRESRSSDCQRSEGSKREMRLPVYIRREGSEERLVNNEKPSRSKLLQAEQQNLKRACDAQTRRVGTRPPLLLFGQDDAQPLKVLCAAGHQEPRLRLWTKLPPLFFFYSRFGRGKKNPRRHFGDKKSNFGYLAVVLGEE